MPENTTQEPTVEAPQGQAEAVEAQGVTDTEVSPTGTDSGLQSPDQEQEAEVSLFQTLKAQKGWESEEDLAKAYKEAEGELTRRSQSLAKTQEDYQAMETVLEGILNGEFSPNDIAEDEVYERPQSDPAYEKARKLEARLDVRTIADKHKDFAEIQPLMSKIIADTPDVRVFEGEKGVELLYKMAKAEKMEQELANAKLQGAKEVQLSEVEKVRANVADGTKAKSTARNKVFTAADVAQMDDATYMANRDEILRQQQAGLIR